MDSMAPVAITTNKAEAAPTSHESDNAHDPSANANDNNKRRRAEESVEKYAAKKKTKNVSKSKNNASKWMESFKLLVQFVDETVCHGNCILVYIFAFLNCI